MPKRWIHGNRNPKKTSPKAAPAAKTRFGLPEAALKRPYEPEAALKRPNEPEAALKRPHEPEAALKRPHEPARKTNANGISEKNATGPRSYGGNASAVAAPLRTPAAMAPETRLRPR